MLKKISKLFTQKTSKLERTYLEENQIFFDDNLGYVVEGIVVNELSDRLEYFSNRRMKKFDDLRELYFNAILINEKIDLEIAHERYVQRLGNTKENLLQFKQIVKKLNDYYRTFLREK